MADISFKIASKELKIAQIVQFNQLFRLLHLLQIYGHGLYEISRTLMRKTVHNDVRKDSPIRKNLQHFSERVGNIHDSGEASVFCVG